jgi:hypothetical protein
VWRKKDEGWNPKVAWKFLDKNVPDFNPVTEICKLCTREKFHILLNPAVATLNHKTEIFSSCRHRLTYIIGDPPEDLISFYSDKACYVLSLCFPNYILSLFLYVIVLTA